MEDIHIMPYLLLSCMDDLATEVICARIDKIITHMLTDNVPQGYEQWSKQILRQSIIKARKKPIGKSRKIRYLAFYLLGSREYRLLQKIVK